MFTPAGCVCDPKADLGMMVTKLISSEDDGQYAGVAEEASLHWCKAVPSQLNLPFRKLTSFTVFRTFLQQSALHTKVFTTVCFSWAKYQKKVTQENWTTTPSLLVLLEHHEDASDFYSFVNIWI